MQNIRFPETDLIKGVFPKKCGRNGEIEIDPLSKVYTFKLLPGMNKPSLGDLAVVSCQTGFQVCVITSINATSSFKDHAYVVGIVDAQNYTKHLERLEKKKVLYEQLIEAKEEVEEQAMFELLASKSPKFKTLLEEYNSL